MKIIAIVLVGLATFTASDHLPAAAPQSSDPPEDTASDGRDDTEESFVAPHGLHFSWPAPSRALLAHLREPMIPLKILNYDPVAYALEIRTLEDAGSLQTRRLGAPLGATIPARGSLTVPIAFGSELPALLTHSGLLAASVRACPVSGGPCVTGGSDPLFFHRDGRSFVVYGEDVLCQRFSCGALRGRSGEIPEAGTWRVMGGGPLLRVPVHEGPDTPETDVAAGGDR